MSRSLCLRPSVSTESFPNTDFTLPLPLTKEASHLETCLAKPECDPSESFKQTFHQFQREQHSLESHAFWVPAAGQVLVQVFLQLWSPDDSIQPTGQSLGAAHSGPHREPRIWDAWDGAQRSPLGQATWGST